jgi:hypothetical protein
MHQKFYTSDWSTTPISDIWNLARRKGMVGLAILLPILLFKKYFGRSEMAAYAEARMEEISKRSRSDLSEIEQQSLSVSEDECRDCQLHHLYYFSPPWIGGKQGVGGVWINDAQNIWCIVFNTRVLMNSIDRSRTIFTCHSKTDAKSVFTTTNDDADIPIAEQTINRADVVTLGNESSIRDVIALHQKRTAERNLVRYEADAIDRDLLSIQRAFHDELLKRGLIRKITQLEYAQLTKANKASA